MKSSTKEIIVWTPRVICIISAMFMFLFAFDVFNENQEFSSAFVAFLKNLFPVVLLIALLILSMRWAIVGAIVFNLIGISYIIYYWGKFSFISYIGVTVPIFVVGIFFLFNWLWKEEIESGNFQSNKWK